MWNHVVTGSPLAYAIRSIDCTSEIVSGGTSSPSDDALDCSSMPDMTEKTAAATGRSTKTLEVNYPLLFDRIGFTVVIL